MSNNIEEKILNDEDKIIKIDEEKTLKIEQRIITTVAETLRIDQNNISLESKFVDDLGADSLDLVELMMAIEAAFNCDIPDEEAGKILTVSDAVKYVEKHINA